MSRMRAMLFGMLAAISSSSTLSEPVKYERKKEFEKQFGGFLYANPYGPKPKNQRQKRKLWASNPHLRNK